MTNGLLTKLKVNIKRLLGRIVYSYIYLCRKLKNIKSQYFTTGKGKKRKKSFSALTRKHWRLSLTVIFLIIGIYYGIGAAISSKINSNLEKEYKTFSTDNQNTLQALAHVIKEQVDKQAWTPALPMIFPASVLDNLPNFQLGAKNTANFFLKRMAKYHKNKNLKEATKLLDYNPTIWLFSQTKENKLAPGSAKQYRNALTYIKTAIKEDFKHYQPSLDDLLYILKNTNILLDMKINELDKHINEHSSELLDFKADDLFYDTLGSAYTLHYLLSAVIKDYQNQIVSTEQYENITSALYFLENAIKLKPVTVKNSAPNDIYGANHLYYLAYYLSRAQYYTQEMYYAIAAANMAEQNHED
jgi:hypothetical protein